MRRMLYRLWIPKSQLTNTPLYSHVAGETVPAERAAELEAESGRLREELTQAKEEVATLKARLCAANPNMVSFGSRCILWPFLS